MEICAFRESDSLSDHWQSISSIPHSIELSTKIGRKVLIIDLSGGIYFLKDKSNVLNPAYKIVVTKQVLAL
jgi:hypothetical protein